MLPKTIAKNASSLILELLVEESVFYMIQTLPFLALPVINPIFVFITKKILGRFTEILERVTDFKLIDLDRDDILNLYNDSAKELSEVIKNGNKNEIKGAKEDFKNRFRNLIRIRVREG